MSKWTRRKFITVTSVAAVAAAELAAQQTPQRPEEERPDALRRASRHRRGAAGQQSAMSSIWSRRRSAGCRSSARPDGTPKTEGGRPVFVKKFKDAEGRIRRQGAQFRVFAFDSNDPNDPGREVTLDDSGGGVDRVDGAPREQESGLVQQRSSSSATSTWPATRTR